MEFRAKSGPLDIDVEGRDRNITGRHMPFTHAFPALKQQLGFRVGFLGGEAVAGGE